MKTKPTAKPVQVETVALPFGDRDIFAAVRRQMEQQAQDGTAYETAELDRYIRAVLEHHAMVTEAGRALVQIKTLWKMQPVRTKERDSLEASFLSALVTYLREMERTFTEMARVSLEAQTNLNAHRAKGQ